MASSFAEALKKLDLTKLEEGIEISDTQFEAEKRVKMLSGWVKLLERNASEKEKFNFARDNGFVSENHLNLWIQKSGEYEAELEEFEKVKEHLSKNEYAKRKRKIDRLRIASDLIKEKTTYRIRMKRLGKKELSPYGEDLLEEKSSYENSNVVGVDIEKTIKNGYISRKRQF